MGLISKENLIKILKDVELAASNCATSMRSIINEVEKMPDDAVDVIRCKDCKYFERRSVYRYGLCDVHCNGIGDKEVTSEDQYCSWGEKNDKTD